MLAFFAFREKIWERGSFEEVVVSNLIADVVTPEKTVPKGTEDFFNVFLYI